MAFLTEYPDLPQNGIFFGKSGSVSVLIFLSCNSIPNIRKIPWTVLHNFGTDYGRTIYPAVGSTEVENCQLPVGTSKLQLTYFVYLFSNDQPYHVLLLKHHIKPSYRLHLSYPFSSKCHFWHFGLTLTSFLRRKEWNYEKINENFTLRYGTWLSESAIGFALAPLVLDLFTFKVTPLRERIFDFSHN